MEIDNRVTGKTKLMGVIGNPIEHSISPQLHNSISSLLSLDYVYVPFKVDSEQLSTAINGLKALNFVGFNVTVPYKKDVIQFIDEVSKEALLMGAVNTVKNIDGKLHGYNTDADGFARSFKEETREDFKDKTVVMIGAGGAARSMAIKIAYKGAKRIIILNRSLPNALEIADSINNNIQNIVACCSLADARVYEYIANCDIVINTTSVGMHPETESCPLPMDIRFSSKQIVYDVIYNPLKTQLLRIAEEQGCKVVNGLGMLFYQGIYAYEIWTGKKLSEEILKKAYESYLTILKR